MSTDEKGNAHVTPIVETVRCQWCGKPVEQRAEGRRRRFCGPTCRQRHRRAHTLF